MPSSLEAAKYLPSKCCFKRENFCKNNEADAKCGFVAKACTWSLVS